MKAWRISHRAYARMDGSGAATYPGRWNGPGQRAIYCGTSFAIALLERLCYAAVGRVPKTDVYIEIEIPEAAVERFDPAAHSGWERPRSAVAKSFGVKWLAGLRSAALLVPSVVTRMDWNVVLNPAHPDFAAISWSPPQPFTWDRRLFGP
jgi:RES domain-containing protein